ncbi:DUF374 domain-containing protein [Candidatus Dependentiae bacterium]|nr:DUF374 domain-containing protein [Candidatus Dependentiae bacterium]
MGKKKLLKKIKQSQFVFTILTSIAHILLRAIFATYRLHVAYDKSLKTPPNATPGVFYAWHQNIIASTVFFKKQQFSFHCIVSPSRDGKFAGTVAQKLGIKVLYGSAHKKPIALVRNALRTLQNDKQLFLIGDGSRGPTKQLQPGVTYLAQQSNLPIFFIDCQTQWKLTVKKSWDKFQIPIPFSKIFVTIKRAG